MVPIIQISNIVMIQEGTTFDHDFYVVVGKQCRTENVYAGHQHYIFIYGSIFFKKMSFRKKKYFKLLTIRN